MFNSNPKSAASTTSPQLSLVTTASPGHAPHKITFSVAESALAQNKCFKRDAQGRVIQSSVALTSLRNFSFTRIDLKPDLSITELGRVIERLTQAPRQSLNMCVPKEGQATLLNARRLVYDDPKTGDKATLEEIDRTLIILDQDGRDTRDIPHFDWDNPAAWIDSDLPDFAQGCDVIVVYSSSARVPVEGKVTGTILHADGTEEEVIKYKDPNPHILKAHYFLIPDRPYAAASMKAYLQEKYPGSETGERTWDMALFTPNQIHFTGNPTFLGVDDPFAGSTRIHVLNRGKRAVLPPEIVDLETWRAQLEAEEAEEERQTGMTRAAREHQDRVMGVRPLTEDTSWIAAALQTVDPSRCEYNTRLAVCRALCSLFGGSSEGNQLWHDWISQASGSKWGDYAYAEAKWDDSLSRQGDPDRETATLLGVAKRLGGFSVREWRYGQNTKPLTAQEVQQIAAKGEEPHWRWCSDNLRMVRAGTRPTSDPLRRPGAISDKSPITVARAYVASKTTTSPEGTPIPPVYTESALWTCDPASLLWSPMYLTRGVDTIDSELCDWSGKVICGVKETVEEDGTKTQVAIPYYHSHPCTSTILSLASRKELTGVSGDPRSFSNAKVGIACGDTFLTIEGDKLRIEPLSPAHRARHKYAFTYADIKNAKSTPLFDSLLNHLFSGDQKVIDYILTWCGIALLGMATTQKIPALILQGVKGCGKSTFVEILRDLFPEGSTSEVAPEDFDSEDKLAQMIGKILNVETELDEEKPLTQHKTLRKVIFGEGITIRQIYRDPIILKSKAANIWCCNDLPQLPGVTDATWDRLCVIPLNAPKIRDTAQDNKDLARDIVRDEKAGVVRKMLEAAERYFSGGKRLQAPQVATEAKDSWRENADIVAQYVREWIVETGRGDDQIGNQYLYDHFTQWCKAQGQQVPSATKFGLRLKQYCRFETGNSGGRYRQGIVLREVPGIPNLEDLPRLGDPDPTPCAIPHVSSSPVEALKRELAQARQELAFKEADIRTLREAVKAHAAQAQAQAPAQAQAQGTSQAEAVEWPAPHQQIELKPWLPVVLKRHLNALPTVTHGENLKSWLKARGVKGTFDWVVDLCGDAAAVDVRDSGFRFDDQGETVWVTVLLPSTKTPCLEDVLERGRRVVFT